MKIAVTGATGFVGQAVCNALTSKGHGWQSVALSRDHRLVLDGCDAVVHLAEIAHRWATAADYKRINVDLTAAVGRAACASGIPMLFMSSIKVHGDASIAPLTESSPIKPADRYAASKAYAEEALRFIPGLRLTVVRPPLVYGPRVKANFFKLMHAIARGWPLPLASVANRRSLIYVGNLADAIIRCLNVDATFVVSDGPAVSTPQLCREVAEALGRELRLFRFPNALLPAKLTGSLEVDDSAIRRVVAWQPPFTRQVGLRATADWYRAR